MPLPPNDKEVLLAIRSDAEELPVKEFIRNVEDWKLAKETIAELDSQAANVSSRKTIVRFLLRAYGCLLASTMLIFFLQGFGKFSLPESILKWLGGATVGEIAGLLAIAIRPLFATAKQSSKRTRGKPKAKTVKTKPTLP
jgi:hypothetical protein